MVISDHAFIDVDDVANTEDVTVIVSPVSTFTTPDIDTQQISFSVTCEAGFAIW